MREDTSSQTSGVNLKAAETCQSYHRSKRQVWPALDFRLEYSETLPESVRFSRVSDCRRDQYDLSDVFHYWMMF